MKAFEQFNKNLKEACNNLTMSLGAPKDRIKTIYVNKDERLVVVRWVDNTTTKVKCQPGDDFCVDIGVALAYCYKFFGSKTQFRKVICEHTKEVGYERKETD